MAWTVPQTYGEQVSQVQGLSSDIINVMEERHGGITSHIIRNYAIVSSNMADIMRYCDWFRPYVRLQIVGCLESP